MPNPTTPIRALRSVISIPADRKSPLAAAIRDWTLDEFRAAAAGEDELAVLDVRGRGGYADGHLLLAVSAPFGVLEERASTLVPRLGTPIAVTAGGDDDLAEQAASRLVQLGYSSVGVLRGGREEWVAAGIEVYAGVNVLSKAVGELAEVRDEVPLISVFDLKQKLDSAQDVILLDSRPSEEFAEHTIPGAINCPGAELVFRFHEVVASSDALVVITCAGRHRGLVGAQSLRNAGIPNEVRCLDNGTAAWRFAGFDVEHGADRNAPAPSTSALAQAMDHADTVARRFGVRRATSAHVRALQAESDDRTLYLIDIRSPDEFTKSHVPGSRSVPGGQLVQELDNHVGTHNARVVLIDSPDGVRGTLTASWVLQQGVAEVYVATDELSAVERFRPASRLRPAPKAPAGLSFAEPFEARGLLRQPATVVIDVGTSQQFALAHLPGARFAERRTLPEYADRLGLRAAKTVVVASPDGAAAAYVAADLRALIAADVGPASHPQLFVLAGGTDAWLAREYPVESGRDPEVETTDDHWGPLDVDSFGQWYSAYEAWCQSLPDQVRRDPDFDLPYFPQVHSPSQNVRPRKEGKT